MSLDLKRAVARPIASVDSLVEVFRSAEKPQSEHRLGLEHEKFVYPKVAPKPVPYEGPAGIGALLEKMGAAGGDTPFRGTPGGPPPARPPGAETGVLETGGPPGGSGGPPFS